MHLDLRSSSDRRSDETDEALNKAFAYIELKADVEIQRRFAHRWKGHT